MTQRGKRGSSPESPALKASALPLGHRGVRRREFLLFFLNPSLLLSWMFEQDCMDTCCSGCLYAYVLYFCCCPWSAQVSMFHTERHSRNTILINTIIK